MPVPIPGPKVGHDSQKVKFCMIFGRPNIRFFHQFRGISGKFIINNVPKRSCGRHGHTAGTATRQARPHGGIGWFHPENVDLPKESPGGRFCAGKFPRL
jgi:hypothetical protein